MRKIKWTTSEQESIWRLAGRDPEKALERALAYTGLYHVSGDVKLRDGYARLANAIGRIKFPAKGMHPWP